MSFQARWKNQGRSLAAITIRKSRLLFQHGDRLFPKEPMTDQRVIDNTQSHKSQHSQTVSHRVADDQIVRSFDAGSAFAMHNTLRLFALPYAGHPDFDERWRP